MYPRPEKSAPGILLSRSSEHVSSSVVVLAVLVALQATDVAQVVAHVTVEVDPDIVGVHVTWQALAVTVAEQPFEELVFEVDGGPGLEIGGEV